VCVVVLAVTAVLVATSPPMEMSAMGDSAAATISPRIQVNPGEDR
jgi:hypothetical protein